MGKLKKLHKKMMGVAKRADLIGSRSRGVFNSELVVVDTEWDLISTPEGRESNVGKRNVEIGGGGLAAGLSCGMFGCFDLK